MAVAVHHGRAIRRFVRIRGAKQLPEGIRVQIDHRAPVVPHGLQRFRLLTCETQRFDITMPGGANNARRCSRRMRERPGGSVPTNATMTGGTAIRACFRANGTPPMSARFVGRNSLRTKKHNTVPKYVSTHQGEHNHKQHNADFFIAKISSA